MINLRKELGDMKDTEILELILKNGEYQLSTQERREMQDKKKREVSNTLFFTFSLLYSQVLFGSKNKKTTSFI